LSILLGNSCSVAQKNGGIWTGQMDLQQISPKSDSLLGLYLPKFPPGLAQGTAGLVAGTYWAIRSTINFS
jgi:hypothetical protein